MTIQDLYLELLLIVAIPAAAFVIFFAGYYIGKWRQKRFNRDWGLPEESKEEVPNAAEVLGKTGAMTQLGEICQKH